MTPTTEELMPSDEIIVQWCNDSRNLNLSRNGIAKHIAGRTISYVLAELSRREGVKPQYTECCRSFPCTHAPGVGPCDMPAKGWPVKPAKCDKPDDACRCQLHSWATDVDMIPRCAHCGKVSGRAYQECIEFYYSQVVRKSQGVNSLVHREHENFSNAQRTRPAKCVCAIYGRQLVCVAFKPRGVDDDYPESPDCATCEHDIDCHGGAK